MPSHAHPVSGFERAERPSRRVRGADPWPVLALDSWRDTCRTLHLYTQMVGKVRLGLTPKENQWWNVPLYVTTHGLTTSPIAYGDRTFELEFDFVEHELVARDCDDRFRAIPLTVGSVARFYEQLTALLRSLDVDVAIRPVPVEIPHTTPFPEDTENGTYEPERAAAFFRALRRIAPVFEAFRAGFRGKCSPVHFFWGSFDLAVTRFSGRRAAPREGSIIERDAYDEEVLSLGFWPGDAWGAFGQGPRVDASFYAYAAPEPPGLAQRRVHPEGARYDERLKEFLFPYAIARRAPEPEAAILAFAESTYQAGASLAGWDVAALAYP